ncbi:putative carboxymethylenebutenolidase [Lachnellula willkommii]|uniref:Putative carboxymethylenebutenolidase n=1 Tax=Lachnellula willkommii TaxID=215461 RepID=A0A559LZ44_9HELO|nr:putative carboxymethylenebutenolidase [Lachnellula willkommii]
MLIQETHKDVATKADGKDGSMITGPVSRFARQIAGQGYIVAAPSTYHEFMGPEALAYDGPGTDAGNRYKIEKTLAGYDEDSALAINTLLSLKTCTGRIGSTGMCLGGHLAYRCALNPRISAAVTYFATDLHSATLGLGKKDDSLARAGEMKAELALIHGTLDNHVPAEGRDIIRKTLREKGVNFSWYEVAGAQREFSLLLLLLLLLGERVKCGNANMGRVDAFIRDEESKNRYDPAITKICFEILLELFGRHLKVDLGAHDGADRKIEDIC